MMLVKQDFQIAKEKLLLRLIRKAITVVSKTELSATHVNVAAYFESEFNFSITVFNFPSGNFTAFFQSFEDDEMLIKRLDELLEVIKKDDFEAAKQVHIDDEKRWER